MKPLRNVIVVFGCALLIGFVYVEILHQTLVQFAKDYHSDSCDCSTVSSPTTKPHTQSKLIQTQLGKPQTKKKLGPTFLLIMIPILFSSIESRDLIRDTWYKGFSDSKDVMLRYIMGVNGLNDSQLGQLHEENNTYGDIVFLKNFTEGIRALTNKTIALMKWATENVDFTYIIKSDDDTFLYVNNTIIELKRRPTTKRLYYGVIETKGSPIRDNRSKWRDLDWNITKRYLPFARGGCYILSEDLVNLLVRQSHRIQWHPLEDVAVGFWLAPFDFERRTDNLMCFMHRPCRSDFRVAYLIAGKAKQKLKQLFYKLQKESLNMHINR